MTIKAKTLHFIIETENKTGANIKIRLNLNEMYSFSSLILYMVGTAVQGRLTLSHWGTQCKDTIGWNPYIFTVAYLAYTVLNKCLFHWSRSFYFTTSCLPTRTRVVVVSKWCLDDCVCVFDGTVLLCTCVCFYPNTYVCVKNTSSLFACQHMVKDW